MAAARMPSASQMRSQVNGEIWRAASAAAASAVEPRRTCPQPETAVKAEERSMVSRMKRRSSATFGATRSGVGRCPAEACSTERRKRRARCGRGSNMRLG